MNWTVWGAPIAVLSVGVAVGLIIALKSAGQSRRDPTAEAIARKDSLIDQLRALRADRSKLTEDEFEANWNRLLDAAAEALRDAETMDIDTDDANEPTTARAHTSWTRRLTWAAVTAVFFIGLGVTLKTYSDERTEGATMTGGNQVSGTPLAETIATLEQEAQDDPKNIGPLNRLAHIAIQQGNLSDAMKWMDKARALDPDHVEVLTHMAILQASVGMTERAKVELDKALAIDPNFSKALFWKGLIALREGDRESAVASLEEALNNAADREARVMATQALAEARKPPATVKLKGTIGFAAGTSSSKGILFIIVRRSDSAAGPPLAALRLDPRGVPGTFTVTDRDMMMGGDWPEQVWIEARLDTDGNPSTKGDNDLVADRVGPFTAGSEGIELLLAGSNPTPSPPRVTGQLQWASGASRPSTGTVFVIFRRTPTPQGPPVAAVRLPISAVPGPFSAGDQDIMMGGDWPDQVWVQARADADSNAMTKSADDLSSAIIGPISSGSESIALTLGDPR